MIAALLQVAGFSLIGLSLIHVFFPKRFNWKEDLAQLSLLNKQIFYIHCLFLCLVLMLMGLLALFYAHDLLIPTPVNRALLSGLTFFWGVRLVVQWFGYSPLLWRGNAFNTLMHYLFTLLWTFYTVTFGLALWHII